MANIYHAKLFLAHFMIFVLFLPFFQSSAADFHPIKYVSPSNICKFTPHPNFCKSMLSTTENVTSNNVYDYGRYSILKSLSTARTFISVVQKYLRESEKLTISAIHALEDCQFLADLNIDYLSTTFKTVNETSKILPILEAEDVQTLLSAILTNTQTCLDGLLEITSFPWSLRNDILTPLINDTKLHSVSLALFTQEWVPKKKKGSKTHPIENKSAFRNGHLSLKMSARNRAIFERISRGKLLQQQDDDQILERDDHVLVSDVVIVNQTGSGNFSTINEAVAIAPNKTDGTTGYFLIYITAGVYEEYVSIAKNKRYLMMIGDGINQTIITGNHSHNVSGYSTFNSSTFAVVGQGFVAVNITFQNTAGPTKHQAVAVRNSADLSTFYSCSFHGYQDTLYVHSLRQFYRECDIYGTVDFIFGNAAAVFQNCNIYPKLPLENQFNAITAQGRSDPNQNTGISIQNCTVKPADDLKFSNSSTQTYLGRPWKAYSRTIFAQNFLDGFVNPLGWREWSGDFALNTSYYAEFNNTGPGSNTTGRVTWPGFHIIGAADAANFTVSEFLLGDDWLPRTGVPYFSSLV
ncbi:probable pectinesterase/pectinesterase inhibitor 41 [Lycium ferocissimum]|uniref:probable pectinesterase/pectinesterase inhibitor 41 n=1 Tax=Lycium ferocissimum TaxID=112874 RepID=UPI002816975D|nr:probable pectinesterase/pectinesterase inhibitor 41 [Lycium ferocissimum]